MRRAEQLILRALRCAVAASALLLSACNGTTPERAQLLHVQPAAGGTQLEVTQRLVLSPTMLEALQRGIPLRLAYRIDWCQAAGRGAESAWLELRYLPLGHQYELHALPGGEVLRFARLSALLAALDRVRLPLQLSAADCGGAVSMALDLTALPTPLRFPALLDPAQWRLVSAPLAWPAS